MTTSHKWTQAATAFAVKAATDFPDLCDVRHTQPALPSGTGGKVRGALAVHESVPCVYRPLRGAERQVGAGANAFADYEVKMPAEISGAQNEVQPKHQLVIQARGSIPAFTLEVINVRNHQGLWLSCDASLKNG